MAVFRPEIRPDFARQLSSIRFEFWREHRASHNAYQNVFFKGHTALRPKLRQQWEGRDKNALWWWTVCFNSVHPKATVRRHHLRRLKNAFCDALKAKSMDENGRLLADMSERNPKGFPMLKGSLSLYLTPTVLGAKYTDLQFQCSTIVAHLLSHSLG